MNVKRLEDGPAPMDMSCLLLLEQVPLLRMFPFKNSPATFVLLFFQIYAEIMCSVSDESSGTPVGIASR